MLFTLLSMAAAQELHPEVVLAEELACKGDLDGVIRVLEAHVATHPDDVEALWRLARALYDRGEVLAQSIPDDERLPIYTRVLDLALKVEQLEPASGQGYLWHGVALGRVATSKGILSQLFIADDVEKLWLKAVATDTHYTMDVPISSFPGDVYNALGQFYRLVPDWKAMQWIAGTRGDIDKSVEWMRKLVVSDPERMEAWKELGVSLLCKGYKQDDTAAKAEGRQMLQKALTLASDFPTDVIDKKQIPIILSKEEEACGYSRDGWEDLSEEQYKGK